MRMSIDIDKRILEEAKALSGHTTDESAVHAALTEYVSLHSQRRILDLFGKIDHNLDYDCKVGRLAR